MSRVKVRDPSWAETLKDWETKGLMKPKPKPRPKPKPSYPKKAILVSLVSDDDNWVRDAKAIDGLPAHVQLEALDYAPSYHWTIYIDWSDGDRTTLKFLPEQSHTTYRDPLFKGLTIDLRVLP